MFYQCVAVNAPPTHLANKEHLVQLFDLLDAPCLAVQKRIIDLVHRENRHIFPAISHESKQNPPS